MGRITDRLFVVFTTSLIGFIAYSSQIFVIWPWYGRVLSIELIQLLLPFNVLVGLLLWNYRLCVITEPGHVPSTWRPDFQDEDGYEVKKLTRGPRYCRSCENYKPPRAHHCRQCKRSYSFTDHHCPWVNNCVGYFNYGHFIRFLFFVDLACSYHAVMLTKRVLSASNAFWDEPSGTEIIFIVLNYATCIPVLLAVGIFSLYQFYSLISNTTTIEGWEKDKVATLVRRGRIHEIKYPYHLGMRKNIESMLGKNPWLWCLRYPLADGDGTVGVEWPPKDPEAYEYPDEDPHHQFELPDSPWTYENNSVNPLLQPTQTRRRKNARNGEHSAVPPYHPDYYHQDTPAPYAADSDGEDDEDERTPIPWARSGRYEVKPIDREAMLRHYVEDRTTEPGRYNVYVPDPPSEPDTEVEDEVPLTVKVEQWRAQDLASVSA
ncbi:zf-DHHC-domain-containing protein [Epithele typhae]|uniref:zf-DHHC-domain-containing protein n=1 Tax=Epithele typhae TaxID=378194 RepID=UPI0020081EFA|nr:zf-DHHC-domain-containing protein [Epithele typhae]KAH9932044.1 zf-DHHC-domain-containing protein [Epithele typhae]